MGNHALETTHLTPLCRMGTLGPGRVADLLKALMWEFTVRLGGSLISCYSFRPPSLLPIQAHSLSLGRVCGASGSTLPVGRPTPASRSASHFLLLMESLCLENI